MMGADRVGGLAWWNAGWAFQDNSSRYPALHTVAPAVGMAKHGTHAVMMGIILHCRNNARPPYFCFMYRSERRLAERLVSGGGSAVGGATYRKSGGYTAWVLGYGP